MHFVPLCNEQQVAAARGRFPLFHAACLPRPPDYEQGARCALVADEDGTVLAVLHQRPPFAGPGASVSVGALVVRRRAGLGRLLAFLRRFHADVQPWVPRVSVNLPQLGAALRLGDGLTRADVEAALRGHACRPAPATSAAAAAADDGPPAAGGGPPAADDDDVDDDPGEAPVP